MPPHRILLIALFARRASPKISGASKFASKKCSKKAKIEHLGFPKHSPNPSKIQPESKMQNTYKCSTIFSGFLRLRLSSIIEKYAIYLGKIPIFNVFPKIMFLQSSFIFPSKNVETTTPKRSRNDETINAKSEPFFNIKFFKFFHQKR